MNQNIFSSINKYNNKFNKNILEYDKNKCHDLKYLSYCGCYCIVGPTGPQGGVISFADFYALMPPDNTATIAPGTDVSFPKNGPSSGTNITRMGVNSFNLSQIGYYLIFLMFKSLKLGN